MITLAQRHARSYLPALLAGGIAWVVFLTIGQTPIIRASGMALAVVGMALALRLMGPALAVIGGLALAFSPSFWIQTGGAESLNSLEVGGALAAALVAAGALLWLSKRPLLGVAAGVILFAALFLAGVGAPRSLRLTTLLTAWTLFLLVDGLLVSNPRPDAPSTGTLQPYHTYGLLLLLAVGVANDSMFVLLIPAAALGLFLSRTRLPLLYWLALLALVTYGLYDISQSYYSEFWWHYPADQALTLTHNVPYLIAGVWREPERWISLMQLIIGQFSVVGLALGVLGLARLARWYPPVGVVTMIAFGTYAAFGLIYFGADSPVLLLPLLMIQLMWMTYAMFTFGQWLEKSIHAARWLAAAGFTLLPLIMLLRIVGVPML
ncbi:MAG: hypothetical protein IT319_21220 [Anaerolineae bacterium]|nr:hypothetical protein [Anaerolineae bacterium]